MMLSKYKFTDDIFKKLTIVPDAKNHGMIVLVDWSGSMSDVLSSVIQQLMNLAWFCRKINIPFEVYAFSNYYNYNYDGVKPVIKSFDLKPGDIRLNDFRLVNFVSHKSAQISPFFSPTTPRVSSSPEEARATQNLRAGTSSNRVIFGCSNELLFSHSISRGCFGEKECGYHTVFICAERHPPPPSQK